jgi:hypothetical protein
MDENIKKWLEENIYNHLFDLPVLWDFFKLFYLFFLF